MPVVFLDGTKSNRYFSLTNNFSIKGIYNGNDIFYFSFKYVIPTRNIRCIKRKSSSQYLLIVVAGVRIESTS